MSAGAKFAFALLISGVQYRPQLWHQIKSNAAA